jgi:flagellar hook-associated protein 2
VSVSVTAGDSLSTVRDRINNAGAGVRASIVNDGTGSRLVIRSEVTGAENAVKIVAAGDPSLEDLAYSPDELTPGNMTQTLSARDATATINGLPVSSPTNTLSGAVQGLTLTLSQVTTNAVEVTITQDSAAMRKSVDDFVKAYNDLNAYVLDQTRYDPEKKVAGKLQGDSATRSLQTQLRQALQAPSGATAGFSTLSSLGIQLQRNGSLLVNNSLFSTALGDPAALAAAFSAEAPGEANDGFGVRFTSLTNALTDADGLLQSRAEGLRSRIKRQQDKVSDLESRVARTEERLLRQYNTLDNNLGRLNGLGGYVSQQVTAWNNTKR